jgi:hypothetical protein
MMSLLQMKMYPSTGSPAPPLRQRLEPLVRRCHIVVTILALLLLAAAILGALLVALAGLLADLLK